MAKLPYMPFYVGDYLADTQHLSTVEHGAYLLLIMAYWRHGGPLPDDDERLARTVRLGICEWNAIAYAIRDFFVCDGTTIAHPRIDEELGRVREKSEKARISAKKSWESRDRKAIAEQTHKRTQCDRNAIQNQNQNSEPDKEKKKSKSIQAAKTPLDDLGLVIRDRFYEHQTDKTVFDFKKETPHCKALAKKAMEHEEPMAFLESIMQEFLTLRETDKFYRGQPLLPSVINSNGIYSRLVRMLENDELGRVAPEQQEMIAGLFQEVNR